MSRQGPFGFGFSMVIEIVAIVAIVSILPKFDLRPSASAATSSLPIVRDDQDVLPAAWTNPLPRNDFEARPTSYYGQPRNEAASNDVPAGGSFATREAPPLMEMAPQRPEYIEQRLDRSSQQLINGVGSAVADAAQTWLRPTTPAAPPAQRRTQMTQQPTQPRPWIRY